MCEVQFLPACSLRLLQVPVRSSCYFLSNFFQQLIRKLPICVAGSPSVSCYFSCVCVQREIQTCSLRAFGKKSLKHRGRRSRGTDLYAAWAWLLGSMVLAHVITFSGLRVVLIYETHSGMVLNKGKLKVGSGTKTQKC